MDVKEILLRFAHLTNHYVEELNAVSLEQLQWKPSDSEWSLGQMYVHLIRTATTSQLPKAEQTLQSDKAASDGIDEGKTDQGVALFERGGFPPERIYVPPSPRFTPAQPESKEQLVQGLQDVLRHMEELAPNVERTASERTAVHPRFGALQAKEWFALVEMHYRHHLLQKDRLKKAFLSLP
ncbi:DinB family protein [Paenibacillus ferrarius]|uniref:DinB family protein n=1 Tax=Paenibacillus ferrarius TaxID=1469647 RepID=UPI003D2872C8